MIHIVWIFSVFYRIPKYFFSVIFNKTYITIFTCAWTVPLSYHIVSRYHFHDKLVLIASATLLNSFNLHWLFIFQINKLRGKKYSTTVPSHHCCLCILCTLSSFSSDIPCRNGGTVFLTFEFVNLENEQPVKIETV